MRVLIAVALLMLCGALAQRIEPQAAKQEKAQPTYQVKCGAPSADGTTGCIKYISTLSFDLPAKEWDSVTRECCPVGLSDGRPGICWVYPEGGCEDSMKSPVTHHHVSCKDVATDWQQRVLLDSADGKHHCYAFYLLEQKP